ncbi:cupin domain-containing protein [Methylorubrum populi]|jgi:quercetin dioxygenase-like cupin family protein|uniref:Cupin n=2 Tax=Methylobacteriaceae TaxID=119045 RepID=A0A160PLH2_9HYPH|nr:MULTISPECIES: cupin domain-containing protein [Methylobacteriaceae]MBY0256398.1 cupin domain-containing protein [Methylobacterium sp.]MCB4802774.1 cupin domain-containing protein [Methylobacterium brachiatum]MDQ0543408.1 quercetin dioxygenase-like cupin family protein [Methylobacterium brachiatum]OAH40019.1 cupin [Methylorubrum populi]BAU94066.1 cupin [Methylorubrum populi]
MATIPKIRNAVRCNLRSSLITIAAIALGASTAQAGSCPADKVAASGNGQAESKALAKGVTDTVIASTDLVKEPVGIKDRQFRLRRLVIEPGGIVPWHSHGDRPAIIYVVAGEVVEYASTCAVPITHKAGEATTETHATAHWWKNTGSTTAVLLSADLFHVKGDPHEM